MLASAPNTASTGWPLVVDAVADPAEVEAAWRALERDGSVPPFQTFDWTRTWIAAGALPAGTRPLILRGRRGEVTEFLLPLVVE
ncbi:MAG: hypothetical protein OEL76_16910, partial [Siculibacillus sp.]|nr:hypothetical protein [Siculibacillus sp.]